MKRRIISKEPTTAAGGPRRPRSGAEMYVLAFVALCAVLAIAYGALRVWAGS